MVIRNLFRHKHRTLITGGTITILTFILVFGLSVAQGISDGLVDNIISQNTGDVIITSATNPDANDTSIEITNWSKQILKNPDGIQKELEAMSEVEYSTKRVKVTGVISSQAKTSSGVFVGIESDKEQDLLKDALPVKEGKIPSSKDDGHWIYISTSTADLYEVEVGDELTVTGQGSDSQQSSMNFQVCGIFELSAWKEYYSYISVEDAQELTGLGENVTQLKVMIKEQKDSKRVADAINKNLAEKYELHARDWNEAGQLLLGSVTIMKVSVYGMCVILLILIIAILINSISMSILERTNEIGVLMSIGMDQKGVFSLFMSEVFLLTFSATLIGEILSTIVVLILQKTGIPAFVEVLRLSFGGPYTYPQWNIWYVVISMIALIGISLIVALLPIRGATKLNPVEAVNYVQ